MRVEVFKRTRDNWYGNYQVVGDCRVSDLVEVSFVKLLPYEEDNRLNWRVCVWGNDDCGMEKDFEKEAEAWNVFLQVIGLEYVDRADLIKMEFVSA